MGIHKTLHELKMEECVRFDMRRVMEVCKRLNSKDKSEGLHLFGGQQHVSRRYTESA